MNQSSSNSPRKSQTLHGLVKSGIFPAISSLSASSRGIPSNEDFHFYSNFSEFKLPTQHIAAKTQSLLELVGSLDCVFKGRLPCPNSHDVDDVYDWLVDVNDEILDRVDMLIDELEKPPAGDQDDGFELVRAKGKRNKGSGSGVRMVDSRGFLPGKAKVPFHISTLRRPQDEFSILVNNSNKPFEHVWLQSSDDGSSLIHPLDKLSVLDFVDKITEDYLPASPLLIQDTPFHFVEDVKDLKMMAAKLKSVNEFSVDLEHNQYRTFQGLTCLMQISTRSEDFVIDTLKLKIHIGPYLREVFKDPSKKKVMHGADYDIIWLQRDFGIYVCNMFDTGQASRVLKLERYSLQFLLDYFCEVSTKKKYQNADWRIRPLPDEMLRYARDDTHYLLSIYDTMKVMLSSLPNDENSDSPLLEVYKRSYDICKQLYEKELLTESSYLHMYGLPEAGFTAQQLAIVSGLYEWRDTVARAEDESTGYILPNKILLLIAKQMPVTMHQLRPLLSSHHTYLEQNMAPVLAIIRHSMQNSCVFEDAVLMLKEARIKPVASEEDEVIIERNSTAMDSRSRKESYFGVCAPETAQASPSSHSGSVSNKPAVLGASIQVMKKPAGAFGALLGTSTGKNKIAADEKDARTVVLENIRSSVNIPFFSFTNTSLPGKQEKASGGIHLQSSQREAQSAAPDTSSQSAAPVTSSKSAFEDVIILDHDSKEGDEEQIDEWRREEKRDESITLSALSTSFQMCLTQNNRQNRTRRRNGTSMNPSGLLQLKPFDYAAARDQVKFGKAEPLQEQTANLEVNGKTASSDRKSSVNDTLPPGKRRLAFPMSGNRSATFR